MSEKVLGFKEKDALHNILPTDLNGEHNKWVIDNGKLVPVVSLKWLEEWLEARHLDLLLPDLIKAAEKEAKRK